MVSIRRYMGETVGWVSAVISLSAFTLNSMGFISGQSVEYLVMNIIACFLMMLYAISKKAHASWVLNSIFMGVAVIALIKSFLT